MQFKSNRDSDKKRLMSIQIKNKKQMRTFQFLKFQDLHKNLKNNNK